jgi:hypothetical protein
MTKTLVHAAALALFLASGLPAPAAAQGSRPSQQGEIETAPKTVPPGHRRARCAHRAEFRREWRGHHRACRLGRAECRRRCRTDYDARLRKHRAECGKKLL